MMESNRSERMDTIDISRWRPDEYTMVFQSMIIMPEQLNFKW
jgi:ABC-type proline/glycine betaine transport system ATPase subunit